MLTLREYLKFLEDQGALIKVDKEVSTKFEIASVMKKLDQGQGLAVMFKNVKKYEAPVVGNLCVDRKLIAKFFGVEQKDLSEKYLASFKSPKKCRIVDSGPVKEKVVHDVNLLKLLPVLTHHEKDAGPYITSGVSIYNDPYSHTRSESIHRHQVKGKNRLSVQIMTRPLIDYFKRKEAEGEAMELAIVIGVSPSLLMSSATNVPEGYDKFRIAGALDGSPVDLVKCETIDVEVPAQAEVVIEGRILPNVREVDGPFGESFGTYTTAKNPVMEVSAITHREDFIYHALLSTSTEALNLVAIPSEALMLEDLRNTIPTVNSVRALSSLSAIISLHNPQEGDARSALLKVISDGFKHVLAVDDDIDIYDYRDLEWAVSTRVQGDKDIVIVPNLTGPAIDPSSEGGITTKVGVDATKPFGYDVMRFEKIKVPGEESLTLEEYIPNFFK